MIRDVTVKSVEGDGAYFNFTFEDDNSNELLYHTLYPLYDGPYPQKELVYTNLNSKDGLHRKITEFVKFTAPMPVGYTAAYQIAHDCKWSGLKGELSISRQ